MCKKSICVANFRLLNSQYAQPNQQFYFVNCQTLSIWKCHFAYRPQAQHSQFLRVEVTSFVANKLNYLISCGPPQAIVASNSAKPHDTSLRCELQKLLLYIHYSSSPHTTPNIHIHNKCSVTSSISHTKSAIQTRTDDPCRPKMTSYRNITSTNICAKVILTWRLQIVCSTQNAWCWICGIVTVAGLARYCGNQFVKLKKGFICGACPTAPFFSTIVMVLLYVRP